MFRRCLTASYILMLLLLVGCSPAAGTLCPPQPPGDLAWALSYAANDQLDFQFPLDELGSGVLPSPAVFCTSGTVKGSREYHAAEDYYLPAGTPVYAIADGNVSFSGRAGGYGWLIIIDHPQANIYSLYGHLSPSRWRLESGPVAKGDLIAYLGDPDENGGSPQQPLRPHLHLGIRAGQRSDYPGAGEWRWQAGWIKPCPRDLGWLRPSEVITAQELPPGGFPEPGGGFLEKWGVELAAAAAYLLGAVLALIFAVRRSRPILAALYGGWMVVGGYLLLGRGMKASYALFALAILLFGFTLLSTLRRSKSLSAAN